MRTQGNGDMGRVIVDVALANNRDIQMAEGGTLSPDQVRRTHIAGVVDSGASHLVLPASVAAQLGLPEVQKANVQYADRRTATRALVDQVEVELFGRRGTFKAVVEPDRTDALIGAIILEDLDLLVDCRSQTLRPRDPSGVLYEIE